MCRHWAIIICIYYVMLNTCIKYIYIYECNALWCWMLQYLCQHIIILPSSLNSDQIKNRRCVFVFHTISETENCTDHSGVDTTFFFSFIMLRSNIEHASVFMFIFFIINGSNQCGKWELALMKCENAGELDLFFFKRIHLKCKPCSSYHIGALDLWWGIQILNVFLSHTQTHIFEDPLRFQVSCPNTPVDLTTNPSISISTPTEWIRQWKIFWEHFLFSSSNRNK